ncbi:MAG: hypothetical protein C5B54_00425 [Acidobacteria bacterium]|nr:MAG: hypothetical protein C5B54_00425 [Acidobacteriota bacterium]
MSFRTTIILAILLIGLGAFAYFYEYKGGEEREKKKAEEKTLLKVKKEDVAEVDIQGLEKPIKAVPAGDNWKLTSPIDSRADSATVERILGNFENLKYQQIIEESPKDLAQYGLDKPKLTVELTLKKDGKKETLQIGAKNPVENSCYIRLNGSPRVYMADGTVGDIGNTTLFDLRDKKLTDFVSEKVQSLSLRTTSDDFQFKKESGIWKMVKPVDSPASDSEISSFLSALEFLRATKFIDQPSTDLSQYGLKDPAASVGIAQEKGMQQTIDFGKKEGEQLYVNVGNTIAAVSDSFTTYFQKKLEDWREKKLLIFNRFDAADVFIKTSGKEYHFKKATEDKWSQEAPAKAEIDGDKLQDLLQNLETAEIVKYSDTAALKGAPSLEIFVTLKDWQDKTSKKHLVFGESDGNLQAVKNDDYNTVVSVNGSVQQSIVKALGEIKPKK